MKKILIILLALLLCSGCSGIKKSDPIDDNYRVMYQVFVGSFSDSNQDGIGDLPGLIQRLDYLNDGNINSKKALGVQGLWLSPIFASPSYHKYDVSDYYTIDADFGTMEDLKALLDACHQRNVIVILDLVLNHTSNQHLWFKEFVKAHQRQDSNDYYYDFYSWKKENDPTDHRNWRTISGTTDCYECNFAADMPELNWANANVRKEMLEVARYYLDLGVDGFRFDAAKYIYYNQTSANIGFWNDFMARLKDIKPDLYTVGEVWSSDTETIGYHQALNCFDFTLSGPEGLIAATARNGNVNAYANYVVSYLDRIEQANPKAMFIPFISNHDMDRSAGYLLMMNRFPYIAANLLLLSPGSPFIYYGEEIAMKGSRGSGNTDANRRLAMLWGDGDTVRDPIGTTFDPTKQINGTVAEQLKNEDSLLNYYRKVIQVRNRYPQIARGDYAAFKGSTNDLGGFIITYKDEVTGLFHNTSSVDSLSVDVSGYGFKKLAEVIGLNSGTLEDGILTLGPQTSAILN